MKCYPVCIKAAAINYYFMNTPIPGSVSLQASTSTPSGHGVERKAGQSSEIGSICGSLSVDALRFVDRPHSPTYPDSYGGLEGYR